MRQTMRIDERRMEMETVGILIEFALTFFAWRRGWKAYSLIPLGVAVTLGVTIGVVVELVGGVPEAVLPLQVLVGLLTKLSLGAMVAFPLRQAPAGAPRVEAPASQVA
jgi:hypothetical protein